ncbi:hypothetical protein M9458_015205, partial [Cirrhinus mrigala]
AQVDLFATQKTSQCPLWFSLTHPAPLGLDAMVQTSGESVPGRGHSTPISPVLAGLSMVLGPDFPSRQLSMEIPAGGTKIPPPGVVEVVGVVPEGAHL